MSRYIDADKLMLNIRLDKRPTFRGAKIPPSVKETMFAYLDSAPHIDIVRCGECRYFIDNLTEADTDEIYDSCRWDWSRKIPTADDFCSYGERKEGE